MKYFKNNFLVKFVGALFLIGIIIGFLFYFTYKPDLSSSIDSFKTLISTTNQNTFISNIILISAIFILSISIVGLPALVFYIFYEGLSIGFTLGLFMAAFHAKGLIFYLLFFIVSKLIYTAIMLYFSIISIRYIIKFVECIINKNREELYRTIVYHFYRFIIILVIVIVNSSLIYFLSNKILSLFINLI